MGAGRQSLWLYGWVEGLCQVGVWLVGWWPGWDGGVKKPRVMDFFDPAWRGWCKARTRQLYHSGILDNNNQGGSFFTLIFTTHVYVVLWFKPKPSIIYKILVPLQNLWRAMPWCSPILAPWPAVWGLTYDPGKFIGLYKTPDHVLAMKVDLSRTSAAILAGSPN